MKKDLTISVVIPAYNAGAFIERAIGSVLAQRCPAQEVIVVDDGSTDNTADIVRGFADRVRLISQPNAGVSAARNAGIGAATGDWTAFLDADDEWLPGYLQSQTELLARNPELVWSQGNYFTCDSVDKRKAPFLRPEAIKREMGKQEYISDYLTAFQRDIRGHLNTSIIRKTVLLEAGLFDETLACAEDLDLWWRVARRYPRCGFLAEPQTIYYVSTAESLTKKQYPVEFYIQLIRHHLDLFASANQREAFEPVAAKMLRLWIRGMLFDARGSDIQQLVRDFSDLFPSSYKVWTDLATSFPPLTAWLCRMISKVVRKLNLRRRVVAPPSKKL